MGYYTRYSLKAEITPEELAREIHEAKDDEWLGYAFVPSGESNDSWKGYEHEAEMRALSLRHPGKLFTLHGKGEEAGDVWNEYYRDGKMQREQAVLTIGPFDETKLE
jgi:hypothetical protein